MVPKEQQLNQHLHIGMVPRSVFIDWERKRTAEGTRIWAKLFSPGNLACLQVSIPVEWSNFFTILLMSPDKYAWAKEFLSLKALTHLKGMNGHIDFSLPKCCPSDKELPCSFDGSLDDQNGQRSLALPQEE